jgi:histidinol phosphatase-like enzyme (inositol monophosphatase family)
MSTPLDRSRLAKLEDFAVHLARGAGDVILPLFRADHGLTDKGAVTGRVFDPVTEADKGAEAAIRSAIAARFPDHGVIGEEYGEDRPDAEFVWVLDPIDGTRAFISGLPLWTTLIGLRHHGAPVVGVIAQPFTDEYFVGSQHGSRLIRGAGSWTLHTRPCPDLSQALAATTDPHLFAGLEQDAYRRFHAAARLVRLGADAYAYAMVAMGKLDVVVERGLKSWDVEAAVPLLAGAGGLVTDWTGAPIGRLGGQMLIVGDMTLLPALTALLGPAADGHP